ncbi:MAG: inorganic phosphate transporter [Actinomycetota bacterium]|jgi:inorganic phosphate transporter, PiT family
MEDLALYTVVALALAFCFTNGFHDAANSIATVVATRVLTPRLAVIWAATFNFVAFLVFHTGVAGTIANDVVEQEVLSIGVIFAGLVGAITWNVATYFLGLPTSSSHALIGGMLGAAVGKSGFSAVIADGLVKIAAFIVLSPLIGLSVGFVLMVVVLNVGVRVGEVDRVNRVLRRLQLASAGAYSLGHGLNDAQKTMGVILALLIASDKVSVTADVPLWVVLAAHTAIALGTLTGGWRVVHTLGNRITRLQPAGGVAAESAAAATIFLVTAQGIPVSTTQTITGAIVGVGSIQRLSAVRWGVAGPVVMAWILTIPAAAGVAAGTYAVLSAL